MNRSLTRGLLLAAAASLALMAMPALAAPAEVSMPPPATYREDVRQQAQIAASRADDVDLKVSHAKAMTKAESRQEIEALQSEVRRLRAVAEMCGAVGVDKSMAKAAAATSPPR